MRSATSYDAHMLTAITNLRGTYYPTLFSTRDSVAGNITAAGRWRVIALTNNFGGHHGTGVSPLQRIPEAELQFLGWQDGPIPNHLRKLFDHFYDSSAVGLR